ncbi:MAG: class I SAM-dependent methyltransferase [Armatimonas sp.]
MGGLAATKRLADSLSPAEGESVLDVGSGFGGPARFLAATYGCQVVGIDLTPAYVEVAELLSQKTGLSERATFVAGNALELPFSAESFDHAWTQHVAMNIANKERLYQEIYRVLRPGGRLAIYDVMRGEGEPVLYPVPWAAEPDLSFLITPVELTKILTGVGFHELSQADLTSEGVAWFANAAASTPTTGNGTAFTIASILGGDSSRSQAFRNIARNLAEGRTQLLQIIVQK